MRFSVLSLLVATASAATFITDARDFLLVTTTQIDGSADTSKLANVSATTLFNPFNQEEFLLRLIGPGYGYLSRFELTDSDLHTLARKPHSNSQVEYNSTGPVKEHSQLAFAPRPDAPGGNIAFRDGYLLTVNGDPEGWSICHGPMGQSVIYWKGSDSSCVPTYLQAASNPPY
ncbi:hypothetical protein K470DRAFT_282552 [Piedraia hortae CBS 480.64]|uniref:Cell wall protein PhiA n=1 Tax=Piedraia hortae CBS 480.64 TaxID=1314780 RepID=A0A6A7BX46_9PEZI|nr:hypothetical protein K470DRAFT_282552 [Piedraia hortae CBS 480.64]